MKNELSYTKVGDYQLPNLTLNESQTKIGKYGRMRRDFLKENSPILFNIMVLEGKLFTHLSDIETTANQRMEQMMNELARQNQVNEQLKAENPMLWVQMMNSLKEQAEETILSELIYS